MATQPARAGDVVWPGKQLWGSKFLLLSIAFWRQGWNCWHFLAYGPLHQQLWAKKTGQHTRAQSAQKTRGTTFACVGSSCAAPARSSSLSATSRPCSAAALSARLPSSNSAAARLILVFTYQREKEGKTSGKERERIYAQHIMGVLYI